MPASTSFKSHPTQAAIKLPSGFQSASVLLAKQREVCFKEIEEILPEIHKAIEAHLAKNDGETFVNFVIPTKFTRGLRYTTLHRLMQTHGYNISLHSERTIRIDWTANVAYY